MKQAKKRVFRKKPRWTDEQIAAIYKWAEEMRKKIRYPPMAE